MSNSPRRHRPSLVVEELEFRQLLSVTVTPGRISLKSITNGNGAFHIRVISDTPAATAALQSGSPLVITLTDQAGNVVTLGKSERINPEDINHDGIADQTLKFRRSALASLAAGDVTVTVGTDTTDQGVFSISGPGRRGRGHGGSGGSSHGQGGGEGEGGLGSSGSHSNGHGSN